MEFLVVQGDLTRQVAGVLVNAVNSSLQLEHGVARAIREAAGEGIQEALLDRADDGDSVDGGDVFVTDGYDLPVEYVIHAVAVPLGTGPTEDSIRSSTRNALSKADSLGVSSLAMPALGCGLSRFSLRDGGEIICRELAAFDPDRLDDALLVGYSTGGYETLRSVSWEIRQELDEPSGQRSGSAVHYSWGRR